MAITLTQLSMQAAPVARDHGMQVAVVRLLDTGAVQLVLNATNGDVTMELDAADAAGLASELAASAAP
jgi:hypothetical protein